MPLLSNLSQAVRVLFRGTPSPIRATDAVDWYSTVSRSFGPGMSQQPSHERLLQENIGVPDMATRAIANRIASLDLLVKVERRIMAGTTEDEILDDHPLKQLLDRPHPNLTTSMLLRLAGQHIVTVGEAYWLKVGSRMGVPVELHPIPPTNIWPLVSRGVVQSYGIRYGDGSQSTMDARHVIRFYLPDPESFFESEGYLGPTAITADALKFSGQHLRSHYQNDATPKTTLEAGENAQPFGKPELERFNAEWRRRYASRSGADAGIPAMLPVGYRLVQLALASGADITPLLEHWTDEQLMGFGVPKSILGKVVSGDRSSAETNQYVFDRHTVKPITDMMADVLTLQLAPDFDPSIFVEFEKFVSDDKDYELRKEAQDLALKVRSINMVREERGDDPVEWGEIPIGTFADVPYTGEAFEPFEPDVPEEPMPEEEEEPEPPRARTYQRPDPGAFSSKQEFLDACIPQVIGEGKSKEQAVAQCNGMWENRSRGSLADLEWERVVRRERKYVPLFQIRMARIFSKQRRSVIAKLKALPPRSRIAVNVSEIFKPEDWERLFETQLDPIRKEAYRVAGAEGLAQIAAAGFDVDTFIFTAQSQLFLAQESARLVKYTGTTTQRAIARALMEGNAQGEGVEQIAKRIRQVFEVQQHRARTIARTELLKATQSAQQESFEQSGVVERKQWNTSRDAAVRDSHIPMDGVDVGLRENFTLGDGELAYEPGIGANGTMTLSARNTINCRCFLTPVFVREGSQT